MEDEKLPDNIESWRISDKTDEKTNVICNVFGVLNEASDVVCVRKYLSEGTPLPPIKNKSNLSELTCKWIAVNKLKLNDIQYLQIRDVLDVKDYVIEKNYDLIKQYESQDFYYMKFADYSVYLHDGEIPWVVKFQKNNYVLHQYKEGNVALFGYNIYIKAR